MKRNKKWAVCILCACLAVGVGICIAMSVWGGSEEKSAPVTDSFATDSSSVDSMRDTAVSDSGDGASVTDSQSGAADATSASGSTGGELSEVGNGGSDSKTASESAADNQAPGTDVPLASDGGASAPERSTATTEQFGIELPFDPF